MVDYVTMVIGKLTTKPIVIGHSFGGFGCPDLCLTWPGGVDADNQVDALEIVEHHATTQDPLDMF